MQRWYYTLTGENNALSQTWDAPVRHRLADSCSHVTVSTASFRYEYQPFNELCEQVSGLLTVNILWAM
jgi:hypothetical protein